MTENKGDLISREALKKSFEDTVCIEPMPYAFVKQIIDNAPTVEAIPTELHEKILDQTAGELLECQSNLRTQGEWKLHGMIYYCSVCGHECGESGDNFCGNCGADMREVKKNEH